MKRSGMYIMVICPIVVKERTTVHAKAYKSGKLLGGIFLSTFVVGVISIGMTMPTAHSPANSPQQIPIPKPLPKLLFNQSEIYGEYYFGDGLGANCTLTLRSNGRFTFLWTGCLGVYDRNQGTWHLNGDVVVLHPEKPYKQQGFEGMDIRFIPVKRGARYLLIDENGMPGFCAEAAKTNMTDDEYVRGFDYVKIDTHKPSSKSPPIIPERFREFYQKGSIKAKVIRVDRNGKVVLNKGAADRLKLHMLMTTTEFERINLEILAVSEHEAMAQPFYFWNSDQRVKTGDQFSTGTMWSRPRGTGSQRFASPPYEPKAKPQQTRKKPHARRIRQ